MGKSLIVTFCAGLPCVSIDLIWLLCAGRSAGTSLEHEKKSRGEEEGPQTLGEGPPGTGGGVLTLPIPASEMILERTYIISLGFSFLFCKMGFLPLFPEGIVRMK